MDRQSSATDVPCNRSVRKAEAPAEKGVNDWPLSRPQYPWICIATTAVRGRLLILDRLEGPPAPLPEPSRYGLDGGLSSICPQRHTQLAICPLPRWQNLLVLGSRYGEGGAEARFRRQSWLGGHPVATVTLRPRPSTAQVGFGAVARSTMATTSSAPPKPARP